MMWMELVKKGEVRAKRETAGGGIVLKWQWRKVRFKWEIPDVFFLKYVCEPFYSLKKECCWACALFQCFPFIQVQTVTSTLSILSSSTAAYVVPSACITRLSKCRCDICVLRRIFQHFLAITSQEHVGRSKVQHQPKQRWKLPDADVKKIFRS